MLKKHPIFATSKEVRAKFLDLALYPNQHQKSMGSILSWDPSSIQVFWKSVQRFLCDPAEKPINQQPTNQATKQAATYPSINYPQTNRLTKQSTKKPTIYLPINQVTNPPIKQSQFTLGRITIMHTKWYNDTKDTANQWLPRTAEKKAVQHLRECRKNVNCIQLMH